MTICYFMCPQIILYYTTSYYVSLEPVKLYGITIIYQIKIDDTIKDQIMSDNNKLSYDNIRFDYIR